MSRKKLNVLQIGKYYHPYKGGIENHQRDLCKGLKEEFEIEIVAANTSFRTKKEIIDDIPVIRAGRVLNLSSTAICPTFSKYIKDRCPDVVHVHCPNPMGVISYFSIKSKHKLIVTFHNDIVRQKYSLKLYKPILKRFLDRAERIIVHNRIIAESSTVLSEYLAKITEIPAGIDPEEYKSTLNSEKIKRDFQEQYGDRIILFIGRLVEFKGVKYLIEAMKGVDAQLIIIGYGPLEKGLKNFSEECCINNKVTFVTEHTHEEKIAYLHASKMLCMPSIGKNESFGIVQLEAMVCGKPVINTSIQGSASSYISLHNETGLTVTPKNSEELAEAINRLLSDPEFAVNLGNNGRKRVLKSFTKELNTKKNLDVYREVLDGN